MKIALVADTHFGYPRFYDDAMQQGREAIEKACKMADLIILAGDIFDMKVPKMEVLSETMDILECGKNKWRAESKDGRVPVLAIHGTHERRSKESVNPVQILERAGFITNIHDRCEIFERDGERVAVCGFGGVPDEFALESLEKYSIKPSPGMFNIFVFHQTISNFIPVAKGVSLKDLPPGFDLYVCGHIHKRRIEKLDGDHIFVIPGSTVITQLKRDETEEKGFFLFDTKTRIWEFVPIKSRVFLFREISFVAADTASIKQSCRKAVDELLEQAGKIAKERNDSRPPIIKIQISGSMKEGLRKENLDLSEIIGEYGDRCVLELENNIDAKNLGEKIEAFRRMFEEKKTIKELGIDILKTKLGSNAGDMDVEYIFEKMSDSKNIDEFIKEITKQGNSA
ncbi:MAG: DNA repair exonuclease [Candidatus Micrarchaeia archaeon]